MELSAGSVSAYLRLAFDQVTAVADRLGDELVVARPVESSAGGQATNSVAALVVHSCAVTEWWLGHVALGRPSNRDREAEFRATATVEELRVLVAATLRQAEADLVEMAGRSTKGDGDEADAGEAAPGAAAHPVERYRSDASVVLHVIEELYQHLGQMEITADVLLAR